MSALPRPFLTLTCTQKVLEWHHERTQNKLVSLIFLLGQFIQYSQLIEQEHQQREFLFGCRRLSFAVPQAPCSTASIKPFTQTWREPTPVLGNLPRHILCQLLALDSLVTS